MDRGGDQSFDDAFDQLFTTAYRAAFRILGSREDAEDVAVETLSRASLRWRKLRDRPGGWVTTVAVNLALDIWRRRQRAPRIALPAGAGQDVGGAGDVPAAAGPDLDRRLDLARALDRLPRRQREVLVLRYFADLSEAETAATLGISVGSVKQHASRGTAALRQALGER